MATSKRQKQALNTKSTGRLGVIIDPKENTPLEAQIEYLKTCQDALLSYSGFSFVATILHDRDTNEDGTPKQVHIHAVMEHAEDGSTLAMWLSTLTELLDAKREQISIETSSNKILLLQYLRHDRKDKEHYKTEEIRTTDEAELLERLNAQYEKPKSDDDLIQEALLNSVNLTELMQTLGAKEANKYRGLYKDLHHDESDVWKRNFEELSDRHARLIEFINELMTEINNVRQKDGKARLIRADYFLAKYDALDI